jgi:hypothetical protein
MRLLNFCIVILLIVATAYVYEIKFEATLRTTRVIEMRGEVRRERDAVASYRAEWARLENPGRLEILRRRHLDIRPPELWQFDTLDALPERPREIIAPPAASPSASMNDNPDMEMPTGSIPAGSEPR